MAGAVAGNVNALMAHSAAGKSSRCPVHFPADLNNLFAAGLNEEVAGLVMVARGLLHEVTVASSRPVIKPASVLESESHLPCIQALQRTEESCSTN